MFVQGASSYPPVDAYHVHPHVPECRNTTACLDEELIRDMTDQGGLGVGLLLVVMSLIIIFSTTSLSRPAASGTNYQGASCKALSGLDFLFYPLDVASSTPTINRDAPICISSCPNENSVSQGKTVTIPQSSIDIDSYSLISSEFLLISPVYASDPSFDYVCIPRDPTLRTLFFKSEVTIAKQIAWMFTSITSIFRREIIYPILGSLTFSIILFWWLPTTCPTTTVFTSFTLAILLALGFGLHLIAWGFSGGYREIPHFSSLFPLSLTLSVLVGTIFVFLGLSLAATVLMNKRHIDRGGRVLDVAGDVLTDAPHFFLGPIFITFVGTLGLLFWAMVARRIASRILVSTVSIGKNLSENGNLIFLGRFEISHMATWNIILNLFWIFILIIFLSFINVLNRFVASYCATVWYFGTPHGADERDVNGGASWIALHIGTTYRLGSIVVASIVYPLFRPIAIVFAWAADRGQSADSAPFIRDTYKDESPVADCFFSIFSGALPAIGAIVDLSTNSVFVEMSLASHPLADAISRGRELLKAQNKSDLVASEHIGTASLASAGTTLFLSLSAGWSTFALLVFPSESTPSLVAFPAATALFVSLLVWTFASGGAAVWEAVGDSLLYCYLMESRANKCRGHQEGLLHATSGLKALVVDGLE